jgi:hypothetical protein
MRNWYLDKNSGKIDPRPQLWGSSETKYDDIYDLVALRVPADQDRLSEFILNNFGVFFQVLLQLFWLHMMESWFFSDRLKYVTAVLPTSRNEVSRNALRYSAPFYVQSCYSAPSHRSILSRIIMLFSGCLEDGPCCSRFALAGLQMREEIRYLRQQQLMRLFW